jgi:hypothetical protein
MNTSLVEKSEIIKILTWDAPDLRKFIFFDSGDGTNPGFKDWDITCGALNAYKLYVNHIYPVKGLEVEIFINDVTLYRQQNISWVTPIIITTLVNRLFRQQDNKTTRQLPFQLQI